MSETGQADVRCSRNHNDTQHIVIDGKSLCGRRAAEWPVLSEVTPDQCAHSAWSCERCQRAWLDQHPTA